MISSAKCMSILYRLMEIIFAIILVLTICVMPEFKTLRAIEKFAYIYMIGTSSLTLILLVPPDVKQIIKYLKMSKEERQFYKEDTSSCWSYVEEADNDASKN